MSNSPTKRPSFDGLEVAAFESRRAEEIARLISNYGGVPRVAPSMREIPLENNSAVFEFGEKLFAGKIQGMIFMTGVGVRTMIEALETRYSREEIVRGLSNLTTVARGPKPIQVLREFGIPVMIRIPEPNTWHEILQELDENSRSFTLRGSCVAIQEYGTPNEALIRELKSRGVEVLRVPVYRWAFPENMAPLESAIESIVQGRVRIALFTNAVQVDHVVQVASARGVKNQLIRALHRAVVCSVGPTCTEALRGHGIPVDLEPSPPKMGTLILDAARKAHELLHRKDSTDSGFEEMGKPNGVGAAAQSRATVLESAPLEIGKVPELWRNSRFMKVCRLEPTDVTPVWLMRQAGRYMKEYRDLRARVPFLELCKNPDLASEVTVTAATKLGVDAAIIFADLLLIIEPLGLKLEYDAGEGPVVQPVLREPGDVDRLREVKPHDSLGYLYEAIRRTRAALPPHLPLIGFAGAPFTVASYMIEGGASKTFRHTKTLMYRDPGAWQALMERLARELAKYVNAQIAAGVQAVQIFDTWVGCLGPEDYRRFVAPYTRLLIKGITPGPPIIHFGIGTGLFLEDMRDAGGDVIGLDFRVELDRAWTRLGEDVAVQGNLDPVALYADLPYIQQRVRDILNQAAGRPGHIFNLGHGILPDTPEENVIALVKMVHEMSQRTA